jgi:hypothetical protein
MGLHEVVDSVREGMKMRRVRGVRKRENKIKERKRERKKEKREKEKKKEKKQT